MRTKSRCVSKLIDHKTAGESNLNPTSYLERKNGQRGVTILSLSSLPHVILVKRLLGDSDILLSASLFPFYFHTDK